MVARVLLHITSLRLHCSSFFKAVKDVLQTTAAMALKRLVMI